MSGTLRTFTLMAALTALLMGLGWLVGGRGGMILALIFAGVGNVWAWWNSDRALLRQAGAVRVDAQTAPDLVALVAALAQRAGLPMPAVYVLQSDQPNAFATGRDPQHAAVAVTQGLLRSLNRDELAGVLAHELAHIRNRDTLTMTVAATLAGAIAMLGNLALFTGGREGRGGALSGILAMIFAPLAAGLVQMAISRTREFRADALGAEIAGQTQGLSNALRKIAAVSGQIPNIPAERNPASAAMYIINPLGALRMDSLFRTHPSTEARIAALQKLKL
ncbi:M48 family metalloprotease [Paracoccus sp. S1E-3]|uniref:M48 family metalloprotease n=1 Tax=Paracoccus sp. S1E-3 TaxID=2756130 RepID=UPI0015EF99F6|nr:M48 family metalloprotease [Paracoccus sp. S1E-3]MBA4490873.1 M48 family metalloprotease [Paracoccus sp. S1E-3]